MGLFLKNLQNESLSYKSITKSDVPENASFERADLVKSQIHSIEFKKTIFSNMDAKGATFKYCVFIDCIFHHANLVQAVFDHCTFEYTNEYYKNISNDMSYDLITEENYLSIDSPFEKAGVSQTQFLNTTFNCCFMKSIGFRFSIFEKCTFRKNINYSVSFENALIDDCSFDTFNLSHSACYGLIIKKTNIEHFVIQAPKIFQIIGIESLLVDKKKFNILGIENLKDDIMNYALPLIENKKLFESINALILIEFLNLYKEFDESISKNKSNIKYISSNIYHRKQNIIKIEQELSPTPTNKESINHHTMTLITVIETLNTNGLEENYMFYSLEDIISIYKLFLHNNILDIRVYERLNSISENMYKKEKDPLLKARYLYSKNELDIIKNKQEIKRLIFLLSISLDFNNSNISTFLDYLESMIKIAGFNENDYKITSIYSGSIDIFLELFKKENFPRFMIFIILISSEVHYTSKEGLSWNFNPSSSISEVSGSFEDKNVAKGEQIQKDLIKKIEPHKKEMNINVTINQNESVNHYLNKTKNKVLSHYPQTLLNNH